MLSPAVERAIAAERAANVRLLNGGRLVAVLVALAVALAFEVQRAVSGIAYVGPSLALLGAYGAAAALAFSIGRGSAARARLTGYAAGLVDVPFVYVLLGRLHASLVVAGFADDGRVIAAGGTAFFLLLVFVSAGLLARAQVYTTALLAAGCNLALQIGAGVDQVQATFSTVAILFGAVVGLAVSQRGLRLVSDVAVQQLRRERLSRYFSPQVAEALGERGEFGAGEIREVTVLVADLRDFTALSAGRDGAETVAMLNEVFAVLVEVLFRHGGTLDKYLGDGLLAYFGAPVAQPDHAARAVRCALDCRAALADLNRRRAARGAAALRLGLGLHSGAVVVGDVGVPARREYTLIGEAVNLAARVEEETKRRGEDILLTGATRARLGDAVPLRALEPMWPRGGAAPLDLYAPLG